MAQTLEQKRAADRLKAGAEGDTGEAADSPSKP